MAEIKNMKAPRNTTHVRLDTEYEGTKRFALQPLKDMDCLKGSPGRVTYLKQLHGKDKYKELATFNFDGEWPLVTEEQVAYEVCPECKQSYPQKCFNIRQLKTIHTELLCRSCEGKRYRKESNNKI